MLLPLIAVGLLLIWIGFVVVDMIHGQPIWPIQQARTVKTFFDSHRVTSTLFVICIVIAIRGHYVANNKSFSLDAFADDFYSNYFSEIIGIAATVFLIDRINRKREQERKGRAEKERLIAEMGSTDNDLALFALKKIRQRGWLEDGSLVGLDFSQANLRVANLHPASLQDASWSRPTYREQFCGTPTCRGQTCGMQTCRMPT